MAVVQPVYLARHQGGAVHILVIASSHRVRTSVVLRDHVTSEDARQWPLENRALTTAMSSSSTCIPCGRGVGGGGGDWDLGLRRLGAGVVGGMCGERGCMCVCVCVCLCVCVCVSRGGRSNGPYADSLPLSDHFQGGGGLGLGGGGEGGCQEGGGGGGRLHSLTNMA